MKEVVSVTVGENIKKYRLANGLTQKQLGNMLGLAEITIRQYENNKREPSFERLYQIADILNISITDLMNKEEYNIAYEEAFNKSFDKMIFNTMRTFFSIDNYILEKEKDLTYSLYEIVYENHTEKQNLILSGLTMVDLEDMETWIHRYIQKVVDCITQIKTNPDYIIQPYDPPYYPNDESDQKQFEEIEKEVAEFRNKIEDDKQKGNLDKFSSYTHYEVQKELDKRKKDFKSQKPDN